MHMPVIRNVDYISASAIPMDVDENSNPGVDIPNLEHTYVKDASLYIHPLDALKDENACPSRFKNVSDTSTCSLLPTPSPSPTSTPTTNRTSSLLSPKCSSELSLSPQASTQDTAQARCQYQQGERPQASQKRKHVSTSHPSHPRANPSHIPRPRNAFILFRSYALSSGRYFNVKAKANKNDKDNHDHSDEPPSRSSSKIAIPIQQNEASREIAKIWRNVDDDTRTRFEEMAREEKRRHKEMYPDYRYAPRKVPGQETAPGQTVKPTKPAKKRKLLENVTRDKDIDIDPDEDEDEEYIPRIKKRKRKTQLKKVPRPIPHQIMEGGKGGAKKNMHAMSRHRTPPAPDTSPELESFRSVSSDGEDEEGEDTNQLDGVHTTEEQGHNRETDEDDEDSGISDLIALLEPKARSIQNEPPHPEFTYPSQGTSGFSDDDNYALDESRVPMLASSVYYLPTFTYADRTYSLSPSTSSPILAPVPTPAPDLTSNPMPATPSPPPSPLPTSLSAPSSPQMQPYSDSNSNSHPYSYSYSYSYSDILVDPPSSLPLRSNAPSPSQMLPADEQQQRSELDALVRRAVRPYAPVWYRPTPAPVPGTGLGMSNTLN